VEDRKSREFAEYRRKPNTMIGELMGLFAGIMTAAMGIAAMIGPRVIHGFSSRITWWMLSVSVPAGATIIALLANVAFHRGQKARQREKLMALEEGMRAELRRNRDDKDEQQKARDKRPEETEV
jgi:hypothetical protein